MQDALSFWPVIIAFICGILATAGVETFIVTTLLTVGSGYLMVYLGIPGITATVATLIGWFFGLILRHTSPDTFDSTVDSTVDMFSSIDFSGGDCGGFSDGGCDGGGGGD